MKLSERLKKADVTINVTPRGFYLLTTHHKVPAEGRLIISDVACGFSKFHKVLRLF